MVISWSPSSLDNHFNINGLELMIATPDMKKLVLEEQEGGNGGMPSKVKVEGEHGVVKKGDDEIAQAALPRGDAFILVP